MNGYEQLRDAANQASQRWRKQNDFSMESLNRIMQELHASYGFPKEQITYFKLLGHFNYPAEAGSRCVLPQAFQYDEEAGEWNLGVHISLGPPATISKKSVSFGLFCKVDNGRLAVRWADGEYHQFNPDVPAERMGFCNALLNRLIASFDEPKNENFRKIGFSA